MKELVVACAVLVGCHPGAPIFDERGFVHPSYGYHIGYGSGRRDVWYSGEWRVENYTRDDDGEWFRLGAAQYWHRPMIDLDADGFADPLGPAYLYDLRLRHVRSNGMIWVRTVPVPLDLQQVDLAVLARNYVENIAGGGVSVAVVGTVAIAVSDRRYASRILDQMPMQVDGMDAYGVVLEVASVEQLQLPGAAPSEHAALVLMRAPFGWREWNASGYRDWPVLVVAGYSNSPAEFQHGLGDFERLLAEIDLDGTVQED